jgi:DNA-directed RNA polymerase subunit alpha
MEKIALPKSIKIEELKGHRAIFTVEPLYPGYGTTVGNALRRILLSSLPGAAITNVKFEGATHEFSTIPFVKEDVVDILLNLKQVRLKLHTDEPVTLTLNCSGEMNVTAGDIDKNSDVEIANPKLHIATLTDKAAKLTIELTVAKGRGYIPVEAREKEKLPLGTIAIDSIYTPIKNVNFTTEHVRVEQMTNYDKLIFDVTTDGTIDPVDAIKQSAAILVDHFNFMLDLDSAETTAKEEKEEADDVAETAEATEETSDEDKPKKKKSKKADKEEKAE